jgi:hypothetical protein
MQVTVEDRHELILSQQAKFCLGDKYICLMKQQQLSGPEMARL